jgi:cytochrome P450
MEAERMDVNLFDSSLIEYPYQVYEEIRAAGPVVWNGALNAWMVTGFEGCSAVLGDTTHFVKMSGDPGMVARSESANMHQADGAEHVRLRHGFAPLFSRQAAARWERRVADVVDELLTPLVEGSDTFDLTSFTMIPTVIVAEMLGVPPDRHEDFRRWSNTIASNIAYGHEDPGVREAMLRAIHELDAYLAEEMARHRREEPDDLITAMLRMPELTEGEMRSTARLLLVAGFDTTAKLMGNALVALARHPEQRRMVAGDLRLVPATVEEVLRWEGVAQMTPRRVNGDTVLAGAELAHGDTVNLLLAAANRDPDRWPHPSCFDVHRDLKSNLGFGFGPHLCLGAPLARLETRVALERLLTIAPQYRLRDVDLGRGFFVRGPERGFLDVMVESEP